MMRPFDFTLLCLCLADYLIVVPAFLSSSETVLILIGLAMAAAPVVLVYRRFF